MLYLAEGYDWQTQQPELSSALKPVEAPVPQTEELRSPADIIGRATELMELARAFLFENRRIITIRGTGGIGKTVLVHALAERLRYHFHDGIYALSLWLPGEQQLRATDIRRLAKLLNVQHPDFDNPTAVNEQEQALVSAVRGMSRLLLIWDNYETVLWRLGQKEEAPAHPPEEDPAETYDPADRSIIETKQRRLNLLREQRAHSGPRTDPAITIEIEDLERELPQWTDSATTQQDEAIAVQRLVRLLADAVIHLLFTSRQSPVGLARETFYPTAERGHQLGGLQSADSETLIRANAGERIPTTAFVTQLAEALEHHPLALRLAATRWATSQDDEQTFLDNLQTELRKAHDPSAPMYQQSSVEINVRLSIDALPTELRERLLALTVIANPLITPLHGAVIWAMYEKTDNKTTYLPSQAHIYLEQLHDASLLQGQGWGHERNRAQVYTIHPVVAGVLPYLVQEKSLQMARNEYAQWSNYMVSQALDEDGITNHGYVAQFTWFYLPDIATALAFLNPEQQGWAAWQASIVFAHFGQLDQAQQSCNMAQAVAKETNDMVLLNRCYHQHATLQIIRGNLDDAIRLCEQALKIMEQLGDFQGQTATLYEIAEVLFIRGAFEQAIQLHEQCLTIQDHLNDMRGKSATLYAMGKVLSTQGKLNRAMQLYQQSLAIAENLGDRSNESALLYAMAGVLSNQGALDQAMLLYEQALDIKERLGDTLGKSATLRQMAGILKTLGNLDKAMLLYEQALVIVEHIDDIQSKGGILHEMAHVFVVRGNCDKAMQLYEQALVIVEEQSDLYNKGAILHQMAMLQFHQGDYETALRNSRESLRLFQSMRAVPVAKDVADTIHQIETVLAVKRSQNQHNLTPIQRGLMLTVTTIQVLYRQTSKEKVQTELRLVIDETLEPVIQALLAALERTPTAADDLLTATTLLFAQEKPAEQVDILVVIGILAKKLNDTAIKLEARMAAIAAQRQIGEEQETLVQLSIMLYNLAMVYDRQGHHAEAIPLLKEVVALDERTNHPDLESDRVTLAQVRRRAKGEIAPGQPHSHAAHLQ
ncbi:MAG: Tetratricopeptide (TPR) repeat [Chloroflexi bacterium AL-W]|nr:Tetratricopeptide (TPR) repeat [Chloroflexi bacterium AL-N1]NOK66080.1 Tetratricopeptide (TPR) repeat [Chloroflexi bacterium AL-N10]NOK72961.1 Tetratricopeptide (TPR) repeat [Chloroflexi bacterium AL-N5]NOK79858.1 Tetratricopeptide (TPR) repeat [Chloroflexi bacterium AL-W]NOK88286.1 Tetratricopeptide (TPR) repeat [Chloroflexi bacterium AL-N15]